MPGPQFVRFISAAEGRLVPWWGTSVYFGAEVRQGEVLQDLKRIYPLTDDFCRRYTRELSQAIAEGDLLERKREEWEAQEKAQEAEVARLRQAAADAAANAGPSSQPASSSGDAPSPTNASESEAAAEGTPAETTRKARNR